jgi:hypothetical protein
MDELKQLVSSLHRDILIFEYVLAHPPAEATPEELEKIRTQLQGTYVVIQKAESVLKGN